MPPVLLSLLGLFDSGPPPAPPTPIPPPSPRASTLSCSTLSRPRGDEALCEEEALGWAGEWCDEPPPPPPSLSSASHWSAELFHAFQSSLARLRPNAGAVPFLRSARGICGGSCATTWLSSDGEIQEVTAAVAAFPSSAAPPLRPSTGMDCFRRRARGRDGTGSSGREAPPLPVLRITRSNVVLPLVSLVPLRLVLAPPWWEYQGTLPP